ncbi:MAG: Gfo/Idh/MocA family oxidoreductase [Verrucomicrobia bacterium]|nr:Gfo/Idh/MocA family oxidoreductase [Verrucomicrobiota bacterium]MCH8513388.1 Gfo/Idh/MocA family oxidoreductase [Kiritimatiellia bacterium]
MSEEPQTPPFPIEPKKETVAFAVVGCGRVSPTHFNAIRDLGSAGQLVAVCDNDPDTLRKAVERTGADGFESLEEMLRRDDIDVVCVCTPSGCHAAHGILAAKAGKHVLVEKPMDVSLEAARELEQTCANEGVKLFVVKQNRLNSTVELAKAALDKGRFGKLYAINANVIWSRTQEYYASASWRGTRAMDGGAFLNQGIHFVDAMRYLGGEIMEIKSMLATLARQIECEDTGSALFQFENGALGNIFVTMLGIANLEGSLTLVGERGLVKIGGVAMNTIETWKFAEPDPEQDALAKDANYHAASVYGNGHKAFYRQVVDHLRHGGPAPTGSQQGLRTIEAILRIYGEV